MSEIYDIPSKGKLSCVSGRAILVVNMQKQQASQSGLFLEIMKVPQSCLFANFLDRNIVVTVGYKV